ncbi:MAG TPA: 3-oxo-tetronate kinase [Hyphomicrobiaceae bacterium]|nr:3-oxo-tetronate kinase [Hyphomicrobiaceae bacterium]
MLLGCIADDFTGATDLANMLVRGGMRTVQTIGVPAAPLALEVDAVVVALKSRTIAAREAVAQSLAALGWLRQGGCQQIYFKYCSTFDSTPKGNIGPVSEALMEAMGTDFTIACPAFPEVGRTICRGYLFVGDVLLSESGMKEHPLTPMTDANLVRVLQAQTRRKVGLIRYDTVAHGAAALREKIEALRHDGIAIAVVDALSDQDLVAIAQGCEDLPLITAGSGVGLGIALNHRGAGRLKYAATAAALPRMPGYAAVLSGSCSVATNGQVSHWIESKPALRIDPLRLAAGQPVAQEALNWARSRLDAGPVLIYATANPREVQAVQNELGAERAGHLVEQALARIAEGLVRAGVRNLVIAGGETAGAVVGALGIRALRIGRQIDPGVPWTESIGDEPIALALKSGNFGSPDFFVKALAQLES